jgi:radical SAM protein with 4Fe4S-binding SPASM domain
VNDDSDEYKIGDVHNGWNEANILKLANISNKSDKYGCKGCWAIRLCNMCAAKICAMDELRLNSKCEEIRKSTEEDLKTICSGNLIDDPTLVEILGKYIPKFSIITNPLLSEKIADSSLNYSSYIHLLNIHRCVL